MDESLIIKRINNISNLVQHGWMPYIPEVGHEPPTPINSEVNKMNNTFDKSIKH